MPPKIKFPTSSGISWSQYSIVPYKSQENPTKNAERNISLAPIAGFADKDIVYALNKYISVVN